jgi:hypothetical protein
VETGSGEDRSGVWPHSGAKPVTYEELIKGYCVHVGIGDVELAENGAVFELDDLAINVKHDRNFDRACAWAEVADFHRDFPHALTARILQLSMTLALNGGYCLAANGEAFFCMHSIPVSGLTVEDFDEVLAMLSMKVRGIKELLANEHAGAKADAHYKLSGSEFEIHIRA